MIGRGRTASLCALVLVLAVAGCGGSKRPRDPFASVDPQKQARTPASRAAPRWAPVAVLAGRGPATRSIKIDRGAIQWRVRYRCDSGRIRVSAPRGDLAGGKRCPGHGEEASTATGAFQLGVRASGAWRVVVEQQIDTPLHEPPLPAMARSRGRVIARGEFYPVERSGRGEVLLYRLSRKRLALRLRGFRTSNNLDLAVWVSANRRPRTSRDAFRSTHLEIASLKSTRGEQNYLLPRSLRVSRVRSVVIWCRPIRIAYAAARLRR